MHGYYFYSRIFFFFIIVNGRQRKEKLKSFKEGTKALGIHPGLIEKGNSTITPIPQFTGISIRYHNILDDREKAIIKMNNRNKE